VRIRAGALHAAAALLAGLALAACGSGADRALRTTLAALGTPEPVAAAPAASAPEPRCTGLTASIRPRATMPTPGAMPAGSELARIQRRGHLIAGVDQNTLLFAYFNPLDHQIEGLEIDMLRQIAQAIFGSRPNDLELVAVTTAERLPYVESGRVDIVADAITITCARKQQVDFSTVYYDAAQRMLVPSSSSITGPAGLTGKRVCATKGSTSIATIEKLNPRAVPVTVPQRTDCLVALEQGRVEVISTDDAILLGFKAQDPYTQLAGPRLADEPYGMAISRAHPDLVAFVNGVLARMRADGTWRSIYGRWLGKYTATVPAPPPADYTG
jgi:polar amino acid transport system substrate-binding protein